MSLGHISCLSDIILNTIYYQNFLSLLLEVLLMYIYFLLKFSIPFLSVDTFFLTVHLKIFNFLKLISNFDFKVACSIHCLICIDLSINFFSLPINCFSSFYSLSWKCFLSSFIIRFSLIYSVMLLITFYT